MTELSNSSGKCVHRSGLRGVFPQTSTALEVFLQPELSPPSDYLKECRFKALLRWLHFSNLEVKSPLMLPIEVMKVYLICICKPLCNPTEPHFLHLTLSKV